MARNLSGLKELKTVDDIISIMQIDPHDRILVVGCDLGPDEWEGSIATRVDCYLLIVRSMSAVGASSVSEFVEVLKGEGYPQGPHLGELAAVGNSASHWAIPDDIQQLLIDSENMKPGCPLTWAGYEDLWVLAEHPESEIH